MNLNDSGIVNMSNNLDVDDRNPQWSPNGQMLAFTSASSVVIVDQVGEVVGKFAPNNNLANYPSWSFDSEFVAFHTTIDDNFEIYMMRYDGTNLTQLTDNFSNDESCPNWSPDGKYISYGLHPEMSAGFDLYIMHPDGSDIIGSFATWAGTTSMCPLIDWSPHGNYLAAINRNLTVIDPVQPNQVQMIAECAIGYPDWSPDGTKIVFARDECTGDFNKSEIYMIDFDGTNLVRLTKNAYGDYHPVWSPDGKGIAFVSTRDGNREIYIMNEYGNQQTNLTQNPSDDDEPIWQP